jgi:hypothetical protein
MKRSIYLSIVSHFRKTRKKRPKGRKQRRGEA